MAAASAAASLPTFAKHPLTGAPIRIMTTEASVWRDQKTLVWLGAEDVSTSKPDAVRWNRYEVGVTSKGGLDAALAAGMRVDVAVVLGPAEPWAAWMAAGGWESVSLLAVPKTLVEHIGLVELQAMKIKNMICLDEMHEIYPFVGPQWNGTEADAKVLLALALHMGRTGPFGEANPATERPLRGLRVEASIPPPAPLWLIQQYYKPEKARRRKEIDACLKANVENPLVDRIVLLNEAACLPTPLQSEKVEEHVVGERLTYQRVFRWIAEQAPADAIIAFANSDIFLDTSSTRLLWSADLSNKFLALLRWDVEGTDAAALAAAKLFGPRPDSQDTWIVSTASVKAAFKGEASYAGLDFPFGQGGCDNAITLELLRRKFVVANPALTLRTYHFHTSAVRNYDPRDIVSKPAYLYVQPTGFHDMRPDLATVPAGATQIPWKRRSFPRPVAGVSGATTAAQLRTFCTMVARATGGAVTLDPEGANLSSPGGVNLFRAKDVFQTKEGLTFGYDSIHVGRTKAAQDAWSTSELSSMAAALPIQLAAAVPLPDAVARDAGRYVLEYLAKVFVLRGLAGGSGASGAPNPHPNPEFFCANDPKCIEAVKMFQWPAGQVPVVSRDETQQAWCSEALVWPYSDEPAGYPSQEEVAALRAAVGGWEPAADADAKRLVVIVDGSVITDATVEALETLTDVDVIWPGRTELQHGLRLLRGAAGLVMASGGSYAAWAWALPLGAAVWEVQSEMKPSAALLHLCAAADMHHRLLITPKGELGTAGAARVQAALAADVRLVLGLVGGAAADTPAKPLLLMPKGHKGFYDHAGDSFREVARLWGQRGYVELTESPMVTQIWLGAAGKTLLYDRPTLEWLRAAPAEEQSYELALFGNPAPPLGPAGSKGRANAKAWTFWPRRPNLVESLVALGLPKTPFEARPDGLVFYGRSENAVQLGNRKKADWSKACSSFQHVEGTAAYPFTHEEYLVNLSKAKFGLCLAGYGRKCHREVECMAMGCVPIVAQEVDMSSYAEPPQPGVHYFRVSGPEEAAALVASITPVRWAAASAACREWWARNASVEGAWRLTQRLVVGAQP